MEILNQNTTVSKTLKTLVWAGVSAALVAILSAIANNPDMFSPTVQMVLIPLVNVALVAVKNLLDTKTPNY